MKRILSILIATMAIACTNNGDIGDFYGVWTMESVDLNGEADAYIDVKLYYWKFQNDILQITKVLPYNDHLNYTAKWHATADILYLDLTHTALGTIPGELMLPQGQTIGLQILEQTSKKMALRYTNVNGATVTYRLRKSY